MHQSVERVRGGTDIPMTDIGRTQIQYLGDRIHHRGGMDSGVSGPLGRTRQSLGIIRRSNPEMKLLGIDNGLRPRDNGELEGEPIDVVKNELDHYIRNPNVPIPGVSRFTGRPGESLNQFTRRMVPTVLKHLKSLSPGERRLLMSHYSNIRAYGAWIDGGMQPDYSVDPEALIEKSHVEPSSLFHIPSINHMRHIDIGSHGKNTPGLYLGRHGATPFSKENSIHAGLKGLHDTPEGRSIMHRLGRAS